METIDELVKIMRKGGYGCTNPENIGERIQDLIKNIKTNELKINAIREITCGNTGKLKTLNLALFEASENYDRKKDIADMILDIDGIEKMVIESLEERGFSVSDRD